ncbi:MAG: IS110 family transposase [Candidatus Margulisbacteria bacterium]|nr:IS110 family transposase [Candidatus Margulisiibacteriota bacterium]
MGMVYCGVDLHYETSTFRFLNETGETKQAIEVKTNKETIENLLETYQEHNIAYAFEAGNMAQYFHRIVNGRKNTQKIHVVHPYKFKVISESKRKNDKEDSLNLAKGLLKDYLPTPVYVKSEICRQIKFLLNFRRRMIGTRTKIILQAKCLLRGLGVKESQRSLTASKGFARVINCLAEEPFYKASVTGLSAECLAENTKITRTEQQIRELIQQNFEQEYEWLVTIPGISFVTAATILSVVDDISRFERAGQFSSYCGLIPSEHSSGEKTCRGRITKEGVKELRSLFVQAAWTIVRWKKIHDEKTIKLKKKFYRISIKQKNSQKAATAIARHLSRIVFGVLKNKTPYCGEITNRAKACMN